MNNPIEASLSILPHEKLTDILLSLDNLEDIFNACSSSAIFARVCQDDYFWKLRYQQDFGLDSSPMRMTWKDYYQLTIENNRSLPFSVGRGHLGVIDQKGQLSMWGVGYQGQLGDGLHISTEIPQVVLSNVRQVSCGFAITCAITMDGKVYAWGHNWRGNLGMGSLGDNDKLVPTLVSLPKKAIKIDCKSQNSIVLTEDGEVYAWGELTKNLYTFVPIKLNLPDEDNTAVAVAAGYSTFAAITRSGKLYMWGDNKHYLYLASNWKNKASGVYNSDDSEHREFTRPTLVPFLGSIRQISMGTNHFGIVTNKGVLWMAGDNEDYQIGKYTASVKDINTIRQLSIKNTKISKKTVIPTLIPIKLPSRVLYFSSRWKTSLVKLKDGRVLMWGNNRGGQIDATNLLRWGRRGDNYGQELIDKPTEIILDHPIIYIIPGYDFTVAITDDDYINLWGGNYTPF